VDNINKLPNKFFFAPAGGLVGFFVVLFAEGIVILIAFKSGALSFGGTLSWQANLLIDILAPMLISLGAAIPAWGLGAKWWHGLLAGMIAMIVFIYIESDGGKQVDYGVFSPRETLAYISTALVSVLIAVVGMKKFYPMNFLLLTLVAILARFSLVVIDMVEESYKVGFAVSLLAWILFPLAATSFTISEQKSGNLGPYTGSGYNKG
jgi:hypothetical protein